MMQSKSNIPDEEKIVSMFKSDTTFLAGEEALNKKYIILLQVARFADLQDLAVKDPIINAGVDNKGFTLFYVIG